MNFKFDELLSETDNVFYKNWEFNVIMSSEYAWKRSTCLTFKQRHATELGNDQAQCLSPLNICFVSV